MASDSSGFDNLCDKLRSDFAAHAQHKHDLHKKFISRITLSNIWTPDRRKCFLDSIMPDHDESTDKLIFTQYIQTLSILVYINWSSEDWPRFGEIFVDQERTDNKIHECTLEGLVDPAFLGPVAGDQFAAHRYMFCPVDIIHQRLVQRSKDWRLPFEEVESSTQAQLGAGASAEVICEHIAPGHFWISLHSNMKEAPVSSTTSVVVKKFRARRSFEREFVILEHLGRLPRRHEHIVSMLGAVDIGGYLGILLPLAQTDLENILLGTFPLDPMRGDWSPLLDQAAKLAEALQHVHDAQYCHCDLRPANILVYIGDPPGRDLPVGRWKIADFGSAQVYHMSSPSRPSGTLPISAHSAPEVVASNLYSSRSDVWSFGCILARVIACGTECLERFDRSRRLTHDGAANARADYFHRSSISSSSTEVNPAVAEWINNLPSQFGQRSSSLEACKDILLQILRIDSSERPEAREIARCLQRLIEQHRPLLIPHTEAREEAIVTCWQALRDTQYGPLFWVPEEFIRRLEREGREGKTPLDYVIYHSQFHGKEKKSEKGNIIGKLSEIVELLLKRGANVNLQSTNGMTPLMTAAMLGYERIVKILLRNGATYDNRCREGLTSLHYAARAETGDLVSDVLETICTFSQSDKPINCEDSKTGATPLLLFARHARKVQDDSTVRKGIDTFDRLEADWSKADNSGRTPLYEAIIKKDPELAWILIEKKAELGSLSVDRHLSNAWPSYIREEIKKSAEPGAGGSQSEKKRSNIKRFLRDRTKFLS